jgi:hypothetical protein
MFVKKSEGFKKFVEGDSLILRVCHRELCAGNEAGA